MQLDFEKILEILFRTFDKNPPLWIGVGCLFIALIAFLVFRVIFSGKGKKEARKGQPAILNSTQSETSVNPAVLPGFMNDMDNANKPEDVVLTIDDTLTPAISTSNEAAQDDDNSLLEELSIPRPGTVTPPPKRGLFSKSASNNQPSEQATETPNGGEVNDVSTSESPKTNLTEDELVEIERKLVALRELHDAGLIATEIYLLKSREFSRDLG
jgi:hypothetical protein